ncbi:Arm DNA-binding domain-containing protein [Sphingopyxis sp. Geo48]|uniref:Arm DNA-binding domain-containing protein n=1 Tax=Sphingopyxis sp. Geo48 TaxID=545241 RepID=UPI0024B86A3B|nr:Arm DNA-binding domain-containing protein [Sphingopyxis sp. Geo48]
MFHRLDHLDVAMSESVILTPTHIDRLKGGSPADREVPGLSIVVFGPAKKQWRFRRLVEGPSKTVELILCVYPGFSIDEARVRAAGYA